MDETQRQLTLKIFDLFHRRKILIITLVLLSLLIGLVVYLRTPKIYQASCLLSYQQQKISPNNLAPDISSGVNDTVSTLTQILMSRTNLENLITKLNLYPEQREKLPTDELIDIMRKKIVIEPSSRGNIFTISYFGSQPDKVVRVTNELAAKFIEENLKYRQERANETSSYTNEELQMAKKIMDKQENAMRDYKLKNYNEMPDQREINMATLNSLQQQYQGKQDSIQELERTLVLIQDQVSNRRKIIANIRALEGDNKTDSESDGIGGTVNKAVQLEQMKAKLDILLTKYTEKHPETKRVRKLIANLEKEIGKGSEPTETKTHVQLDATLLQLDVQRKNIELSIANIKHEKEQLKETILQYEKWVAAAPIREAEWSALTREYGQLKRHYDYLVSQDLEAKSMLNLENLQKGSQFKIEDPARYPEKPIKPNFLMIVGMSGMIGLGLGVALTIVIDFFDSSFRDPGLLEPSLGIPLLTTIPYVETAIEKKKYHRQQIFSTIMLVLGTGLVLTLYAVVWSKGLIVI